MALTHETRRSLVERVHRKVEGRGIPPHVIEDVVQRVVDALDRQSSGPSTSASTDSTSIVAVFAGSSVPDLGSRLRAALQAEGVSPQAMGSAASGRHTVVTLRLVGAARAAAERVAAQLAVSVSFITDSSPVESPP